MSILTIWDTINWGWGNGCCWYLTAETRAVVNVLPTQPTPPLIKQTGP